MHLFICCRRSHHLILCFPAWPFLGLVGEAASPPMKFTPIFWRGWLLPISRIFLNRVHRPTPRPFGKILRTLLCYWGYPSIVHVQKVRRRLRSCRKFDLNLRTIWWVSPYDLLDVLCSCCWVDEVIIPLVWLCYWIIIVPWFHVWQGIQIYRRDFSKLAKQCPEKSFSCLLVTLLSN